MENSEEGLILKRNREKRDADAALLTACEGRWKAEADAFEALQNGANPNVIDEDGKTPLMHVIEWHRDYWNEAERLVRELLHQGALVNIVDFEGWPLLHQAVRTTSFEIVKMLVDKCPAWSRLTCHNKGHYNLLMEVIWFRRWDDDATEEERVKIAGLFLSQIDTKSADHGFSPLDLACSKGASPKMVDFLLKNKANPNVENNSGHTPLYSAVQCHNPMVIVPLLLSAGADAKRKDVLTLLYTNGRADVLDLLFRLTPNLHTIVSFNGPTLPSVKHPDFLGMISVAKRHKARTGMIGPEILKRLVESNSGDAVCWAAGRFAFNRFDNTAVDFFHVMGTCNSVDLWRYFANDYAGTIHPITGNTLLHIAAREKKVFAIPILMQRNVNPFWRNHKDQTALDVAREVNCVEIVAILSDYACFRPTRVHARWFGPYFLSRAYTFLLAVLRLEPKLPRDVVHLILYHLGQMESV